MTKKKKRGLLLLAVLIVLGGGFLLFARYPKTEADSVKSLEVWTYPSPVRKKRFRMKRTSNG